MDGFLIAFAIALVAELGDKSQIMAFTFALRYRIVPVLIGITLATSAIHLVAVRSATDWGHRFRTDGSPSPLR